MGLPQVCMYVTEIVNFFPITLYFLWGGVSAKHLEGREKMIVPSLQWTEIPLDGTDILWNNKLISSNFTEWLKIIWLIKLDFEFNLGNIGMVKFSTCFFLNPQIRQINKPGYIKICKTNAIILNNILVEKGKVVAYQKQIMGSLIRSKFTN